MSLLKQSNLPKVDQSKSFQLNGTGTQRLTNNTKKIEKSFEEQTIEKELKSVERARLNIVYEKICRADSQKQCDLEQGFSSSHLAAIFQQLNYYIPKHEIDLLIWEVDEDGDNHINKYEFELMYKRIIYDNSGLEPKNLFNMVQFLMYDKQNRGCITVEDTLELLFVRVGRYNLDQEIYSMFGSEEKMSDGQEKSIQFKEYLEKTKRKDFILRQEKELERKTVKPPPIDEK